MPQFKNGVETNTEVRVIKQADETIQSSTTPQSDDELLYPLEANSTYEIKVYAVFEGDVSSDFRMSYSTPSGATSVAFVGGRSLAGAAFNLVSTAGDNQDVRVESASTLHCFPMIINVTTSSTAGNFQFTWAQAASVAENTTVKAGSYLEVRKLI